jgi:hypothetical protein
VAAYGRAETADALLAVEVTRGWPAQRIRHPV